jgi:hypothetical protein
MTLLHFWLWAAWLRASLRATARGKSILSQQFPLPMIRRETVGMGDKLHQNLTFTSSPVRFARRFSGRTDEGIVYGCEC